MHLPSIKVSDYATFSSSFVFILMHDFLIGRLKLRCGLCEGSRLFSLFRGEFWGVDYTRVRIIRGELR